MFGERTVVRCRTFEEAQKLFDYVNEVSYLYSDTDIEKYVNLWNTYEENTCYYLIDRTYCDYSWFKKNKYEIKEFDEVMPLDTLSKFYQ